MAKDSLEDVLNRLEASKRGYGQRNHQRLAALLERAGRQRFLDSASLIRFHEILLFLHAYPPNREVLAKTESLLSTFARRVEKFRANGGDLAELDYAEASGIAGSSVTAAFSFPVADALSREYPGQVGIAWDDYDKKDRMGAVWPRFLPLLEEDARVEANVPYRRWLDAAMPQRPGDVETASTIDAPPDLREAAVRSPAQELRWLLDRFDRTSLSEPEKGQLYDSLELPIRWQLGDSDATRTRMRLAAGDVFYHTNPLLKRTDISLTRELRLPSPPLARLSRGEGEAILAMARSASAVRYRELYGFTYGDPARVTRATLGRGVEVFLLGVPPERRLPLRAYHAGFIFKNGVPIGYVETLTLFERMEIGFNLYYTFRDGESAWLYARLLRLFHSFLGAAVFSLDPYQIGFHNDEAIESGAFWFYRKLGFRPADKKIAALVEREEKTIAARSGYRSPARVLRRIAAGYALFEAPGLAYGAWDNFKIRNLGLAVQRRMAERFGGDAERIRARSAAMVASVVGLSRNALKPSEDRALGDLALVVALIPHLARWPDADRALLARIIKAKGSTDETRYVRLLQQHARLRQAVIDLGS